MPPDRFGPMSGLLPLNLMSVHSLAVFLCDVIKVPEVGIAVLAF
jgi:hypothetical protein